MNNDAERGRAEASRTKLEASDKWSSACVSRHSEQHTEGIDNVTRT